MTRISTFMFANEASGRSYPFLGVSDGHHDLSHHDNDQVKQEKIGKINRFHVEQFAYILGKLRSIREGEQSLLEGTMLVYGSGISGGDSHDHANLPVLLAGRGGGTISFGRHVSHPADTPLNNLYLSMLNRMGVKISTFGDVNGRLPFLS